MGVASVAKYQKHKACPLTPASHRLPTRAVFDRDPP